MRHTSTALFLFVASIAAGCAADGSDPTINGGAGGKADGDSEEGLHVRAQVTTLSADNIIRWPVAVDSESEVDDVINTKLNFGEVTGENLEEMKRAWASRGPDDFVQGIDSADFAVTGNVRNVLSIDINYETIYAYPDFHHAYLNFNSNTGAPVAITDILKATTLPTLAAQLDRRLQAEIAQLKMDFAAEIASGEIQATQWDELHVTAGDLQSFSTTPEGITFHYDAGFPHAIVALEPAGEYAVTIDALDSFIRTDDAGLWAGEY
jgi:hypothetical protein